MRNFGLVALLFFFSTSFVFGQQSVTELKKSYQQIEMDSALENRVRSSYLNDIDRYVRKLPEVELTENHVQEILSVAKVIRETGSDSLGIVFYESLLPKVRKSSSLKVFLHQNLGELYRVNGESVKSIEQFLKALFILEKGNEYTELAFVYRKVARLNLDGENNTTAKEYLGKAREALKNATLSNRKDSMLLRSIYSYRGLAERRLGQYERALHSFDSSIMIAKNYGQGFLVALENGNKALSYRALGQYQKALDLLVKDYNTSLEIGALGSAFNSGIFICDILLKPGFSSASVSIDSVFSKITDLLSERKFQNPVALSEYYRMAARYAEANGNLDSAVFFFKQYVAVDERRDSVNRSNNLSRIQERYLLDKEMSQLELLQRSNKLQATHLQLRTAILIVIGLALIIVLAYVFMLRKKNRKIDALNEMLEIQVSERTNKLIETNKELDTYLYRASHDIRRPIRTLMGLNKIAALSQDIQEQRALFSKVYDTALGMDNMLFKLQMAYELNQKHPMEDVNMKDLIDRCIQDLAKDIEHFNAEINVSVPAEATTIKANAALLKIAIDNIVENALVYNNHEKPQVMLQADAGRYFFYVYITDNGCGIEEIHLQDLFKAYFKISNKTQGSGLGLFLANRAISYLAGEIQVESTVNQGSKFTIKIPLNPK